MVDGVGVAGSLAVAADFGDGAAGMALWAAGVHEAPAIAGVGGVVVEDPSAVRQALRRAQRPSFMALSTTARISPAWCPGGGPHALGFSPSRRAGALVRGQWIAEARLRYGTGRRATRGRVRGSL